MNDRDERGTDVLADAHEQDDVPGGELGGGLGNETDEAKEGASDG